MPKGFSHKEKARIQADLLAQGRRLFGAHGLRKTNVEDLTRAVGISKGAFYLFYESKEALFFEILQQFEAEYRTRMLDGLGQTSLPPRERLAAVLHQAVTLWKSHPLFAQFGSGDLAYLARKLPAEQLQTNTDSDTAFAAEFIAACHAAGMPVAAEPALLAGLLRAIVLLNLHEETIGPGVFGTVVQVLINRLAGYLLNEVAP